RPAMRNVLNHVFGDVRGCYVGGRVDLWRRAGYFDHRCCFTDFQGDVHCRQVTYFQDECLLFCVKSGRRYRQRVAAGGQICETVVARRIGWDCFCADECRSRHANCGVRNRSARGILNGPHDAAGCFLGECISCEQQQRTQTHHDCLEHTYSHHHLLSSWFHRTEPHPDQTQLFWELRVDPTLEALDCCSNPPP